MEDKLVWLTILLALLLLFLLVLPLFDGKIYPLDDLRRMHLPFRMFYAQCLQQNLDFHWFPNIYCGYYLHGDGEAGMYHPLRFLLYSCLPLGIAFNTEMVLNYPCLFLGTLLLLRRWQLAWHGAALGAFIFTFCSFNFSHIVHLHFIAIIAHIPWLLWAIDVFFHSENGKIRTTSLAFIILLTSSQLLLGFPQGVWLSLCAEIFYVLLLLAKWKKRLSLPALLVVAKLLPLAIAGIQLLPTWESFFLAGRSAKPQGYALRYSLPWANFSQLVAPFTPTGIPTPSGQTFFPHDWGLISNGHEYAIFSGNMTLLLALWILFHLRQLSTKNKKIALWFTGLAIVSGVLSTGENGYIYQLLTYIPIVGKFRCPCRHLLLWHLAIAALAAIAFVEIANRQKIAKRDCFFCLAIFSASCLIALWGINSPLHHEYDLTVPILLGPALTALAIAIFIFALRGSSLALFAVPLCIALELGLFGLSYIRNEAPIKPPPFPSAEELAKHSQWRHDVYGSDANFFGIRGYRCLKGYIALFPQRVLDYEKIVCKRLAGVQRMRAKWDGWEHIDNPLPRMRLLCQALVSHNPAKDIEKIDIANTALVELPLSLPAGTPGEITLIHEVPGRIELVTETDSLQLLVISESFHEGWKLRIDGHEALPLRVYGDFLGCVVAAGRHQVEWTFSPSSLQKGKIISMVGVILAILFLVVLFYWTEKSPGENKAIS